jgi:hypothetical protein
MYRFTVVVCLAALVFLTGGGFADIPKLINYQGMLTNEFGDPLTGFYNLSFYIYDDTTGGNLEWSETQGGVRVENGLFNVVLGKETALDLPFDESYWLAVQVENDTMPRIRFTSVGYAYRALIADSAVATMPAAGSHWSVADSVLYTNNYWGIARGGVGNKIYGDSLFTNVNLGVACTTGKSGNDRYYCTVSGGVGNVGAGTWSTVGGGIGNRSVADYTSIGGGNHNVAYWNHSTVGGGGYNFANGSYATIGGGYRDSTDGYSATVGGGYSNKAGEDYATVGGGYYNRAVGNGATVGGGVGNVASGRDATVAGGRSNTASASQSFAAGYQAKANHTGTFVWADSSGIEFASTDKNQFLIRASGGVGIGTNIPSEKLDVNGNINVNGKITYASPHTQYFVVGGEGFVPGQNLDYANSGGQGGAYIESGGPYTVAAPVHLPHGAVVTEFKVFFYDNSSSDMTVYLQRLYLSTGGYAVLADVSSSGISGYDSQTDATISDATIDNTAHGYCVRAYSTSWDGWDLRIMGALITYTIDEAP